MSQATFHPLSGEPTARAVQSVSRELIEMANPPQTRRVKASYDAARDNAQHAAYWGNADNLNPVDAHNQGVRQKLVSRSRYEVENNGYVDGIIQTYATDLVGKGPKLRMQTGNAEFNTVIETLYWQWANEVKLRRKLWCMAHAKLQDGEAFAIATTNLGLRSRVKLDLVLIETEQVQSRFGSLNSNDYADGIKRDEFGNPEWYDVLPQHPGGSSSFLHSDPVRVPAAQVMHWFLLRRPGQHRGVPELRSTLNVGASSRRMREAMVASVENCAKLGAILLKTGFQPDQMDLVAPMSTLEVPIGLITALPSGQDAMQMKAEHPNASYESFLHEQIKEHARPLSMPFAKAACDSSNSNYASGRLDHQTYYAALDVVRQDGNDLVLDQLFGLWWAEARIEYGWENAPEFPPIHDWDWPKHPAADLATEAESNDKRLRNGSISPSQLYSENGEDFEDALPVMANDYGVSPDEMRTILRDAIFNSQNQQASMQQADTQAKAADAAAKVAQQEADKPTPAPAAQPQGAPANA